MGRGNLEGERRRRRRKGKKERGGEDCGFAPPGKIS